MNVRFATIRDTEGLINLRIEYLRTQGLMPDDEAVIRNQLARYIPESLGKSLFCAVAQDGESYIASAMLVIKEKPGGIAFLNGITGEILSVYTHSAYRRKGIATKMLGLLLEKAKEEGACLVDLLATNDGYPLYRQLGFEPRGNDYTPMRLILKK
ncbi:MAG: GNAT family N-acetyltransferase [Clostridia bacterium]|nr:GNAT family N-acetyltransferase [Clostridia bacterium]